MAITIRSKPSALLLSAVFSSLLLGGCEVPSDQAAKPKDNSGIFNKTTQDIGEFDPNAGAVVSDGKIDEGRLATPMIGGLAAYGPLAEKAAQMGVDQALSFFNATNDRYPKDHAEFMEKIIKANNLHLPVLPAKARYQYDVENHKLVVVAAEEATSSTE